MKKKLHASLSASTPDNQAVPQPHHILLESFLDDEYAAELSLLKQAALQPRPEAVAALLQQIAGQRMATQH